MNILELKSLLDTPIPAADPSTKVPYKPMALKEVSGALSATKIGGTNWFAKLAENIYATMAIMATASALLLTSTSVQAISGGASAGKPWIVQVLASTDRSGSGAKAGGLCTGTALNAELIITAKHCTVHEVYYPDGTTVNVQSFYLVPGADIQLLVLSREHPLSQYPTIAAYDIETGHFVPPGTVARFYGYGGTYHSKLKSLGVRVDQHGKMQDVDKTEALFTRSKAGESDLGDSGGPLLINDELVGIFHGPGKYHPDDEIKTLMIFHGLSNALSIIRQYQHSREMRSINEDDSTTPWISAVNVQNGKLTLIMDANFVFYSGHDIALWINGKYSASIINFGCYYCDAWWAKNSTATIKPGQQVHIGDLVQIGIVSGSNNTPETAELLYENTINGVEDVTIKDGRYDIRLSSELMNSGQRLIFWLNGSYAAEVFNGFTYYAYTDQVPGGTVIHKGPATPGSTLEIAVVPGSPGMGIKTPATATKLLYSNKLQVLEDQ